MAPMPLQDALFLLSEARERPNHVGGLQLFRMPAGAGPPDLENLYAELLEQPVTNSLFTRRARRRAGLGPWEWVEDPLLDLEYHVRHSALPKPGRVRELLALCSQLHGSLLDRNRPLWEFHLIEGLEDGRFAVYTKLHHAMVDGVAALRLLQDSLSEDPDVTDTPPPWAMKGRGRRQAGQASPEGGVGPTSASTGIQPGFLPGPLRSMASAVGDVAGMVPALYSTARRIIAEEHAIAPFDAPQTILNGPITGARRFAAESWDLERVKAAGKNLGATLNDVVLGMCSGALRLYLTDLDALPAKPLIAMVPVSLRTSEDARGGGNAVGAILCSLATDIDDPGERFERIVESARTAKAGLAGMTATQITAISALLMSPAALSAPLVRIAPSLTRQPFNVTISNVPGPRKPLYWNGARLEGLYPLSIPIDGQALNITLTSYVDHLEFGVIGCRQNVPHLQRILDHLETSLTELENV